MGLWKKKLHCEEFCAFFVYIEKKGTALEENRTHFSSHAPRCLIHTQMHIVMLAGVQSDQNVYKLCSC